MTTRFAVEALYPHIQESSSFVVVIQRDDVRYALITGILGSPCYVCEVEGTVIIRHIHRGYGAYDLRLDADQMGENNYSLDPICRAVIAKGWSLDCLHMSPGIWSCRRDNDSSSYYLGKRLPIKKAWDGSSEEYLILPRAKSLRVVGDADYVIHVHLADHNHFGIHVVVPQIYTRGNLPRLLEAINGLPSPQSIPGVHPASVFSG